MRAISTAGEYVFVVPVLYITIIKETSCALRTYSLNLHIVLCQVGGVCVNVCTVRECVVVCQCANLMPLLSSAICAPGIAPKSQ